MIGCLGWTADGSRLLLGVERADPAAPSPPLGTLLAVDTKTWEITDETAVDVVPETLELSPDGRSVALGGGWNDVLEIRDAATLDERSTVELVSPDRLTDLSWSEDGGLLLAVGEGGGLQLVDTHTGQARAAAFASDAARQQIEWLPDGRTVAITGGSTVRLFDVDRSVARSGLPATVGDGQSQSFVVPDPTHDLVVLSDQDWVMSYPMTPAAWLRTACAIAGRDLTRAEWDQYLPGRPYGSTCSDLDEGRPPPPPAGRQGAAARGRSQQSELSTSTYPCEANSGFRPPLHPAAAGAGGTGTGSGPLRRGWPRPDPRRRAVRRW